MPENLNKLSLQDDRNSKTPQRFWKDLMVETMQAVVTERRTPHDFPSTKQEIIRRFLKKATEGGYPAKLPTATALFKQSSQSITNFLDLGLMMEQIVKDNFNTQAQLQDIKDRVMEEYENEEKVTITKDAAIAMISALKAKSDAQKILADSVFKQVAANIDIDRNVILEKKMDSGLGKLNINMNLTGTLDEKTQQAVEIARKHAHLINTELIEGEFKIKSNEE